MPFPFPPPEDPEQEKLFLIQDPFGLRKAITPLFLAPFGAEEFIGIGTSFFVAPHAVQFTAMHNITDVINGRACAARRDGDLLTIENASLGVLHDPGLVFGTRISGTFLPITKMFFFPDAKEDPLRIVRSQQQIEAFEIGVDAARLNLSMPPRAPISLPVDLGHRRRLARGDRVMAVGYKEIIGQRAKFAPSSNRLIIPYREAMWGSVGRVTELYPEKGQGHNQWPTIEVDRDWPSGMSGGPIFNEDGRVVGIVSRSGLGAGYGVWLQAIDPRTDVLNILHPTSPGWIRVHAAFMDDKLICSSPYLADVEAGLSSVGVQATIELIAQNANTHEYVRNDGVIRRPEGKSRTSPVQ
jgi:serine protease Do